MGDSARRELLERSAWRRMEAFWKPPLRLDAFWGPSVGQVAKPPLTASPPEARVADRLTGPPSANRTPVVSDDAFESAYLMEVPDDSCPAPALLLGPFRWRRVRKSESVSRGSGSAAKGRSKRPFLKAPRLPGG
jgi:hypothetical protein